MNSGLYITKTKKMGDLLIKIKSFFVTFIVTFSCLFSAQNLAEKNKNILPEIGTAGSSVLSLEKERQLGHAMMKQMRATSPMLHDPVLVEYVNSLGNKLVKHANNVSYRFNFFIINNKEINAFAFFGGNVGIHSGLITTADNESELASVFAHEISHVTQRHLARKIEAQTKTQNLSTAGVISSILLAIINPTVGIAALQTSVAATQQASINYTRSNEQEADRIGISLLARSEFNPHAAATFFGKLAEKYRYTTQPPAMLLTHPLPDSRIAEAKIRAQRYHSIPLAPSLPFELSKARIIARYENDPQYNIKTFQHALKSKQYRLKAAAEYGLAIAYYENKQYIEALDVLLKLHEKDPKNLFYIDVLTDTYIALKNYDKAIDLLTALDRVMPNNQVVTLNLANTLLKAEKLTDAEKKLEDFLLVKPDNFIAYDLLSEVYKKQKNKALMHATNAEIYALLGAYQKAIDELQTAYTHADDRPLAKKRFKAKVLQFREELEKLSRL